MMRPFLQGEHPHRHGRHNRRRNTRLDRMKASADEDGSTQQRQGRGREAPPSAPPAPPLQPTPIHACDPRTPQSTLWEFARSYPELRRWLVANPASDAELLEYIAQSGGPGVAHALDILLESIEHGDD